MTEDIPHPGDLLVTQRAAEPFFGGQRIATVLSVDTWSDSGPLSVENHGSLVVMFSDGEIDALVVYGWRRTWKRINEWGRGNPSRSEHR